MKNESGNLHFDPDELILTKDDIYKLLDLIEKRWMKNPKENFKYIGGLKLMKAGIVMTKEKTVRKIWSEIVMGFSVLLEENARQRMAGEFVSFGETFNKIKKDPSKIFEEHYRKDDKK